MRLFLMSDAITDYVRINYTKKVSVQIINIDDVTFLD